MDPITVLIADAHALLRQRLSRILARQADIQVVGEAANGRQVLSGVETFQPHILLLDIRKIDMGGHELLPKIYAKSPRTKILILVDSVEDDFIMRILQYGVYGCIVKTASPVELAKAIRTIHAGELWVPRKVLTQVLESLRQEMEEVQGSLTEMREALTDREREVVIWAAQGMTNEAIATQLGISAKTVKTHLHNVFRKLNVSRRVQLPRFPFPSPPTFPASPRGGFRRDSRT